MGKWISINEQMPVFAPFKEELVLVFGINNDKEFIDIAHYEWDNDNWWARDRRLFYVTHWIHLMDLDLTKVAECLKKLDELSTRHELKLNSFTEDEYEASWDKQNEALEAVKLAFADATEGINSRDRAMLVSPGRRDGYGGWSWLRTMLKERGLYYGRVSNQGSDL